ncbi:hypothetical protein BH24GEM2_BH24GEM2_04980 [soil metagenome]|nr:hypothetical protein [Gemmatimonadota bacterium]MDQ3309421.1 hypothetical protein [Gemmatimonadota bacterium]
MPNRILQRTGAFLLAGVVLSTACRQEAAQTPAADIAAADTAAEAASAPPLPPNAEPFQTTDFRRGQAAGDKKIEGTLDAIAPESPELNGTYLRVRLSGLDPGPHAWHIHNGPCSQVGRIIVALTAIDTIPGIGAPIVADASGRAEHTTFVPTDMLSRQRMELRAYSVRVHERDGPDPGLSVACARL